MSGPMSIPRSRRDDPCDVVRHLTTAIGARRPTSLGEAEAAAYIDSRMRRAGLRVSADTFRAPTSLGLTYPLLSLIGVLAALVATWQPLPALLLAIYALTLASTDAVAAPLPALARHRDSQNIVATRAATGAESPTAPLPRWRVVLLAPLDVPARNYLPLAGRQSYALLGRILALVLLVVLLTLVLLDPHDLWRAALLVPAAYLLLTLVPLPTTREPPPQMGSASALAVLLDSAEQLGALATSELWAVALGATATGSSSLHDLLARYPFPRNETLFLVLQHIGPGQLCCATQEGLLRQYSADPLLRRLASAPDPPGLTPADPDEPPPDAWPQPYASAASIATALHRRGYRTLTLFTRPTAHTTPLPTDDPPGAHNSRALAQAIRLIIAMVRQIDQATRSEPAHRSATDAVLRRNTPAPAEAD